MGEESGSGIRIRFSDVGLVGETAMLDENGLSVANGRRHTVTEIDSMRAESP
jgi:hypothetical protein